jgi:competence protein ComEC
VTAQVLSPGALIPEEDLNDTSIVLRLTYGRTAFLLTGDAEAEEEEDMLRTGQPLGCDVLKVGHHGSHTSTTPEFLRAAHPRLAVISVGAHNRYGHPSPDVVRRLKETGIPVYRTDRNGAVTCYSDGVTIRAEAMNPSDDRADRQAEAGAHAYAR